MGFRDSIIKLGLGTGETAFRKTFLRASLSEGALPISATTQREAIQKAITDAGAVTPAQWRLYVGEMDDTTLNNTLTEMAHTNRNSFKRVIADLHNTDQSALRVFYAQSDEVVQRQMASAFDGGPAFFRRGSSKEAVEDIAAKQIKNSTDGGKAWFKEKVWPNLTFTNLYHGSVLGVLGVGVGGVLAIGAVVAWAALGVVSAITGLSIPELFGEFFEFIVDPSGAICGSEEGCWGFTDMGQVFFGLIALVGIGAAIKFVKLLKTETSEA